jgi:hypothetical protein
MREINADKECAIAPHKNRSAKKENAMLRMQNGAKLCGS